MSRAPLAYLAGAVLLLGACWPATRWAVQHGAGSAWFALGRAALSAVSACAVLGVMGRLRWPGRADMPALLALGGLQLAAFFALSHAAVEHVGAGRVAVLSNAVLVPAVPLSVLVLHERVSPNRWLAAGVAFAGVVVLAGPWTADWHGPGVAWGGVLLAAAATCWALAIVAMRRWPPAVPVGSLLPWSFALAAALLLPWALLHPRGAWTAGSGWALVLIGLFAAPWGTWCVLQAQRLLPVAVSSTGFLLAPVLGLLLGVAWLGEALTVDLVLGAALVLGGALLAVRRA